MSFKRSIRAHGTEWRMLRDSPERTISSISRNSCSAIVSSNFSPGFRCAIDLAVNTVEIAGFVGVDVQPDGNTVAAPREPRGITYAELLEASRMPWWLLL